MVLVSMEAEVRLILANVLKVEKHISPGLGSNISKRFANIGLEEELPELRGQTIPEINFK